MTTFVGLYRGTKVDDAQLVAVCSDTSLVIVVATQILGHLSCHTLDDSVLDLLRQRRVDALRLLLDDINGYSRLNLSAQTRGDS